MAPGLAPAPACVHTGTTAAFSRELCSHFVKHIFFLNTHGFKTTSAIQTVQLLLWDVSKGEQQHQVTLQRQQQAMIHIPVNGKVPRVGQNLLGWENHLLQKPGSTTMKNGLGKGKALGRGRCALAAQDQPTAAAGAPLHDTEGESELTKG